MPAARAHYEHLHRTRNRKHGPRATSRPRRIDVTPSIPRLNRLRPTLSGATDRLGLGAENRLVGLGEHYRRWCSTNPTIGYVGYTFGGNLGDNACLLAAHHLLKDATVIDWCRSWPRAVRQWSTFDAAMLGGGTLIGRSGYLPLLQSLATSPDMPMFLIGTGVEDPASEVWGLTDPSIAERWVPVLRQMSHVSVRGDRSAAILKENYGLDVPVVGDLALALEAPLEDADDKTLGICLGDPGDGMWGSSQQVKDAVLAVGRTLLAEGWRLRIFTVWPTPDRLITTELARELGGGNRVSVVTCTEANSFLSQVGSCTVLIGERLHAVVLASIMGVPSIALAYRPKTEDFMSSLGRDEWCTRTSDVNSAVLLEQVSELVQRRDHHAALLIDAVAVRRRALEEQAASITALLRSRSTV